MSSEIHPERLEVDLHLTTRVSEFLLGNDLMVAPILEEGATSRDIYIPAGKWRDEVADGHPTIEGPKLLENYPADLFTLPCFTRVSD